LNLICFANEVKIKCDIAAKAVVDIGKKEILREFLGIEYEDIILAEKNY